MPLQSYISGVGRKTPPDPLRYLEPSSVGAVGNTSDHDRGPVISPVLLVGDSSAYSGQSLFHKQFLIMYWVLHPASNITTPQIGHGGLRGASENPERRSPDQPQCGVSQSGSQKSPKLEEVFGSGDAREDGAWSAIPDM